MDKQRKGIGDLMEKNKLRPSHLQNTLIKEGIPGRWEGKNGLQNVYNMINGNVVPRDSYVFVFLAEYFKTTLTEVLMRFTTKINVKERYDGEEINW